MIEVDVAVIGGGPAGVAAALEASARGAAVALIHPGRLGGRAIHETMLPWRSLERAIDRRAEGDAPSAVLARAGEIHALARETWIRRASLTLEDAGVEHLDGEARFTDAHTLVVGASRGSIRFDQAIIATGGRPRQIGAAPDGRHVVSPGQLLALGRAPASLVVVGGGAAGAELVDMLSRLGGVELTWLMDDLGILPRFDRELAEVVGDVVMNRGVRLVHDKALTDVSVAADHARLTLDGGRVIQTPCAVLTLGARPSLEGIGLDALGLRVDAGGHLPVDDLGRSAVAHVLAVGDASGRCHGTGDAEAAGRRAGRVVAGDAVETAPAPAPLIARTRPVVAQVGRTPETASGGRVIVETVSMEEAIAGLLDEPVRAMASKGLMRVVIDAESETILGATAVGEGADELISAVGMAIRLGARQADLRDIVAAVPGRLDVLSRVGR